MLDIYLTAFLLGNIAGLFAVAAARRLTGACALNAAPAALLSGAIYALLALRLGQSAALPLALASWLFLFVHSLTDMNSGNIYDFVCVAMAAAGLLLRLPGGLPALLDGALGAVVGFSAIKVIILISKGAMGEGDAMLMLGAGALLGRQMTLLTLYLGFIAGGLFVLPLLAAKRLRARAAVPLAPFLTAGALAGIFTGGRILALMRISLSWPWI